MKIIFALALLILSAAFSGCAATQLNKLRKRIPAGHADTLNGRVTIIGGWGGTISAKNIDSDGKGRLSADEYTEIVNTPWVSTDLTLTGSSIGKAKLQIKPESETK